MVEGTRQEDELETTTSRSGSYAQVIEDTAKSAVSFQHGSRVGRRPTFTLEEDLVIRREVVAAKVHLAPQGETKKCF